MGWFLVTVGFLEVAMLAESFILHHEAGLYGGHHGDVAGGLSLLSFAFLLSLGILASAGIGSGLGKTTCPINGAMLGAVAFFPLSFVTGICGALLLYISPFVGTSFPFAVGIGLVVMGFIRKPRLSPMQTPNQSPKPTQASGLIG